jgi:hypothetical protein
MTSRRQRERRSLTTSVLRYDILARLARDLGGVPAGARVLARCVREHTHGAVHVARVEPRRLSAGPGVGVTESARGVVQVADERKNTCAHLA